jgi:hypothetical protein
LFIAGASLVAVASGCSSDSTVRKPASYSQYRQSEIEAERQEFVSEGRARLDKLDREIALLEAKLQHESQFVDAEQRAEWSQDLFEKKQKQGELRAELYRAQTVSAEEWKEMRGNVGTALDSMEAGVKKIRDEIMARVSGEEEESATAKLRADSGLCPLDVEDADAEVEKTNTAIIVVLTTDETDAVAELQRKAAEFAKQDAYSPASGNTRSTGAPGVVPVQIAAQNLKGGVRLSFVPTYSGHLDQLHQQLEQDADQLGKDRCEVAPGVTG